MMIPYETVMLFVAASLALALVPGPDNIFVLTQSALLGRGAGFAITCGLCTGLLVHTTAVALGVAVIFRTSDFAFTLLKLIGAAYLLYLAYQAFRAGKGSLKTGSGVEEISTLNLYGKGIIMNVSNPKVAIFFLSFLPQFADPAHGLVSVQIALFGALFIGSAFLVFGAIALGAGFLGDWLRNSPGVQRIMNRVAGAVFLALAVKLVTARQ